MLPTTVCGEISLQCYMGKSFLVAHKKEQSQPTQLQEMTPEANIVSVRFTKSVIASKAAFTYEEAQLRKDDPYVSSYL